MIPLCVTEVQIIGVFVVEGICIGINTNFCNFLTITVQKRSAHAWIQVSFMVTMVTNKNRPNQEIMLSDWLITSHVT